MDIKRKAPPAPRAVKQNPVEAKAQKVLAPVDKHGEKLRMADVFVKREEIAAERDNPNTKNESEDKKSKTSLKSNTRGYGLGGYQELAEVKREREKLKLEKKKLYMAQLRAENDKYFGPTEGA